MKNFLRSLSKNFPRCFPKRFSRKFLQLFARHFLQNFTRHFSKIFSFSISQLRSPRRGYIAILLIAFIPVILLGTRWVLDTVTLQKIKINMMPVKGETQKKCAAQAALAVAQNWNPGLPLSRQKNTALKIADAVYNDNTPVVTNDSNILAKAIPGLQLEVVDSVMRGKGFNPIKITSKSAVAISSSPIEYETCKKYSVKNTATAPANFNAPFFSWRIVDAATSSESDLEKFDELESSTGPSKKYVIFHEDRYQSPYAQIAKNSPTREQFSSASSQLVCCANSSSAGADESGYKNTADNLSVSCTCASVSENGTYTKRKTEGDNRVQVLVENNKIKVVTDNDVGYAFPAVCNVDIVLACPTNAAATNGNNRDKNSDTAGAPCGSESEIASCPIYQIGQAFREFVKQFYHTHGVTMGLIPYSGKVSLNPEVAEKYTVNYAKCNDEHCFYEGYYLGTDPTLKAGDKVEAFLRGAVLYDSCGQKGYDLDDPYKNMTTSTGSSATKKAPYDWNTALTACPIRCRGLIDDTPYQGNVICIGDIFSTVKPDQTKANTLFFRQNSNPCYGGNANLLSMKCEQTSPTHLPNPYYIIEPTADLQKIYEMCGALYPFYDDKNVSNFIFIPVTWANNLWQDWTRDPGCPASGDNLSIPSKIDETTSATKRKKALILVINKPDWFEPNELTYLGFDNDFSELPMIESDRIDFSENYAANADKKFADGTSYDGTIQGAKKILKAETDAGVHYSFGTEYYESEEGTVTLKFPRKYLVKVVVEPLPVKWKQFFKLPPNGCYRSFTYLNGKFYVLHETTKLYESSDCLQWREFKDFSNLYNKTIYNYMWAPIIYNSNTYIITGCRGYMVTSTDFETWSDPVDKLHNYFWTNRSGYNKEDLNDICYYGNEVIILGNLGSLSRTSDGGTTWTNYDYKLKPLKDASGGSLWSMCYGNGKILVVAEKGYISCSSDGGNTWTEPAQKLQKLASTNNIIRVCTYGKGKFVVANHSGYFSYSTDGENWSEPIREVETSTLTRLVFGKDRFFALTEDGTVYGEAPPEEALGYLTFSNISSGDLVTTDRYDISERREFYIEPQQITESDGNYTINMNLENIRLISAEITNRPYEIKTIEETITKTEEVQKPATIALTGITSGTGEGAVVTDAPFDVQLEAEPTGHFIKFKEVATLDTKNSSFDSFSYSNGYFFAMTVSGYIYKSTDAINWGDPVDVTVTGSAGPTGNFMCNPIYYNSGKYIALGCRGYMTVSENGNTWSEPIDAIHSSFNENWRIGDDLRGCCDYNGKLVYFGRFGSIVTTSDGGENWNVSYKKLENLYTKSSGELYGICASGDKILTLGHKGYLCISSDGGLNWGAPEQKIKGDSFSNASMRACAYGREKFLVATMNGCFANSSNGDVWTEIKSKTEFQGNITRLVFAKEFVWAITDSGHVYKEDELGIEGSIQFLDENNNTEATKHLINQRKNIVISANQLKKVGEDKYVANFKIEDCNIISASFVNPEEAKKLVTVTTTETLKRKELAFSEIRLPEMSRVADFSKEDPVAGVSDLLLVERNYLGYNATTKYWETSNAFHTDINTYTDCGLSVKTFMGDYYFLIEDIGEVVPTIRLFNRSKGPDTHKGVKCETYDFYGLHRQYQNFSETRGTGYASFDIANAPASAKVRYYMAGFTLPINTALYYAYYDGTAHNGEWYKNDSNSDTYDASEAAKNATKKALSVLKSKWGDNLRIYLILFRKQTNYKHKVTSTNTNYDYNYLNNCSDIYAKYDVTTEGDLKARLNEIASKIKEWAKYKEAENAENGTIN